MFLLLGETGILQYQQFSEQGVASPPIYHIPYLREAYPCVPSWSVLGSEVTMNEYHALSDNALDDLLLFFEDVIEVEANTEDGWEVDYSVGAALI